MHAAPLLVGPGVERTYAGLGLETAMQAGLYFPSPISPRWLMKPQHFLAAALG